MSRLWIAWMAVGAAAVFAAGCSEGSTGATGPTEGFVCGEDGQTYSVEQAARDDKAARHRGPCDDPMFCDGPSDCFVGDACMPGSNAHWCIPGPMRCNCPGVFEPVCGGDDRNYVNACEAACAGVGIWHEGYCEDPSGKGCLRAGCSGQLCVEEGLDVASTCEWLPVYECYERATCERQHNGQCGFSPTHELVECLEHFGEGMCRIDPRWQDGFEAECESPQVPGVFGVVAVKPHDVMRLGEWFRATFALLEPSVFDTAYGGEGMLFCDGERIVLEAFVPMTPLGNLQFSCKIGPETHPGQCYEDGDCPPGHYCERTYALDGSDGPEASSDPSRPEPPPPGMCVDLCALIDCAPGYVCELGECIPHQVGCKDDHDCPVGWICRQDTSGSAQDRGACERCGCPEIYLPVCGVDGRTYANECEARCAHVRVAYEGECKDDCPVESHLRNHQGECVSKCYGPEQCGDEQHCNATEVCLQDPACLECDVCVGWCVPPVGDCRTNGCGKGEHCGYCRTSWECLPEGVVC